jgi:hypothetical protein
MRPWNRWQDWVTLAIGVAVVLAAIVFADLWSAAMNAVTVLGVVLIAASLVALARPEMMADRYVVGIAGVLLVIAPWAVGYTDLAALAWSSWIGGAITVVMEAMALPQLRRAGGAQPDA